MTVQSAQLQDTWLPPWARPGGLALLPLFAFVALIPVEEALLVSGVGTLSRAAAVVFAVLYVLPRFSRLALRAMPLAGWLFVEWAVLSALWSIDAEVALTSLLTLVQLFAIAVLVADVVVNDPGLVRPLLWTYSLSASLSAVLGVIAFVQGNVIANDRAAALPGQDPAHLAALLLPAFIFCTFELMRGRLPWLSLPAALLTLAGILLSGTRGAWVAVVAVVILFMLPALDLRRKVGAVILFAAMVGAVLLLPGVGPMLADRVATAGSSGGAGRTDIWTVGLHIFGTSPVIGVGFANFPMAYTPEMVKEAGIGFYQGAYRAPHNLLLATGAELGIVGLVLLGLLLVPLAIRRGWGPEEHVVRAILVAFIVDGMFLDLFGNRKHVWLIVGIAAGLAYLARRVTAADEEEPAAGRRAIAPAGGASPDPAPTPPPRRRPGAAGAPPQLIPRDF